MADDLVICFLRDRDTVLFTLPAYLRARCTGESVNYDTYECTPFEVEEEPSLGDAAVDSRNQYRLRVRCGISKCELITGLLSDTVETVACLLNTEEAIRHARSLE